MATPAGNTTKSFVEISEIRDSVLILKSGSLRSIVEVGSTNFSLKSNEEQIAIIAGFQDFLNSVDFPLQIVVTSRKLNIDNYLATLDTLSEGLTNELLKIQAIEYAKFIKGLTELADIMAKKFYIVIPFYVIDATGGSKQSAFQKIKSIFAPASFIKNIDEGEFQRYKTQIDQRIDLVTGGMSAMGLGGRVLAGEELKELFYSLYNPNLKSYQSTNTIQL